MSNGSPRYTLEEYDIRALREARQRIKVVYDYHYGAPRSRWVIKRIETILRKLDDLIKLGNNGGG